MDKILSIIEVYMEYFQWETAEEMDKKLWEAFEQKKSAIDAVLEAEGIYSEEIKQKCLSIYRFQQPDIHFYEGGSL